MFPFGSIKDNFFKTLGLRNVRSPERKEQSAVTRPADECKHQLKSSDDVTRDHDGASLNISGCEWQHRGDECDYTSGVETSASPARHRTGGTSVTTLTRSATHDPMGGGHHTAGTSGSSGTRGAAVTAGETHVKCTVTSPTSVASETSATAASLPVPRPTTLRLLLPGDTTPGAITSSSSGSSSPEVFFDAPDGLSLAPLVDTHVGDDVDEYHESFGPTQEEAEVYKEGFGTTQEDHHGYKWKKNRSQERTEGQQVAMNADTKVCCHDPSQGWQHTVAGQTTARKQDYDIVENVVFTSSELCGTRTEPRHGGGNVTEVSRDHDKDSTKVISDTKHRKLGHKNAVGNRYTGEEKENKDLKQREKSRDMIPNPEFISQGSDSVIINENCDHWEGSESPDVGKDSKTREGGEPHSSVEGRLDWRQNRAPPAPHPLDRCLDGSQDSDLFAVSGGSEMYSLPPPAQPSTVMPSWWDTEEQVPNSATVSNSFSSQARDATEMEGSDAQVSKHEAAPANECKQNPHSSLDPRAECQSEAGTTDKPNTSGRRLLGEVFTAEKPSGSSLREETRKIVMMLSNDRACKVPRPSLGLQDRLQTLSQRSAGRRTTYDKGPRFCSTVVKSIVRNTHHRLQSRRDSFQEFIKSRKEQSAQRVFANPIPCYGSATGATVQGIPSTRNVIDGENKSVHDGVDIGAVAGEGHQEEFGSTIKSSATAASVSPLQTMVRPLGAPLPATVQVPPVCPPQEDMNDDLIHGNKLKSTNKDGGTKTFNANTTIVNKNGANSHGTDSNKVLLGTETPINNPCGADIPNNEVVQMEAKTQGVRVSNVLQVSSDEARPTVVSLRESVTDCSARQHAAPSSPATQPIQAEDTQVPDSLQVSSALDRPEYEVEQVSRTNTTPEVLDKVPGTPGPADYRENSAKIPCPTSHSSADGEAAKMAAPSNPASAKSTETFSSSKTKPHLPQRPSENSSNAIDLQAHIDSLNTVRPKLISRLAEARVGHLAQEPGNSFAGGEQDPGLASTTTHQDPAQAQMVVSPAGVTEGSHNSSSEASKNPEKTISKLHSDSINKVHEARRSENIAEARTKTNNSVDLPSAHLTLHSGDTSVARGVDQPHSHNGAGNIILQEDSQGAGGLRVSSAEASTVRQHATQPPPDLPQEAEATQSKSSESHHLWSCLEDISRLKTDNLVARFRGIRSLLHPIFPPLQLRLQPTPLSALPQDTKQPAPTSPRPQPCTESPTMTATRDNEGQTSIDGLNKSSADGRPPLPPNTRQDSVDECPLPDSRQGSINQRSLSNSRQSSVDECPNIRQGSVERRPSLTPSSRQDSVVDSRCTGQRHYPQDRLNSKRDSSGGRLSSYAERKRSRANSHHPRSRQGSIDCVRPSSRRDSRNIHRSCYSDDRRDSNNVHLHSCTRRGSKVNFSQDLLRKCLEAAVDKCDDMDWEETREEKEVAATTLSQEDLNKSLSKAVCYLDAEKTRTLLKLGADPNVRCGHSAALLRAAKDGALYVVQALLAAGADVDVRSDMGNSSLHVAARGGYSEVAIQLVHGGAHIDAINRSGVTPLQVALAQGHLEVARTLLRLHADMFLPNKVGETAYEIANHLGYMGLSATPLEVRRASAPGTRVEPTPTEVPVAVRMIQGIEDGCPATVEACLAEGASPNTIVPLALHWPAYATVLHRAAHYGHDLIVRLLLAAGAHVNSQDVVGNTPLHAAAQSGHNHVVKILLRDGALPQATSQSGMTPLHRAASKGKEFTCNLLLRRGCDPQAQDNTGLTPADWARKRGFKALAKKLVYRRRSSTSLLADSHRKHYLQHLNQLHEAALKAAQQEGDAMQCQE